MSLLWRLEALCMSAVVLVRLSLILEDDKIQYVETGREEFWIMPTARRPGVFPETEIVDASELMQRFGLSSLEVSNGERTVGILTAEAIARHAASDERTRLVGSIMTLPPDMPRRRRPRRRVLDARRRRHHSTNDRIALAVRAWLEAPSPPAAV